MLVDRQRRVLTRRVRPVARLGGPVGAVIDTGLVAVVPASMSAWVIVCVAVHFIDAPGASDEPLAGVQTRSLTFGSVTVTAASVVLPLLVAMIV